MFLIAFQELTHLAMTASQLQGQGQYRDGAQWLTNWDIYADNLSTMPPRKLISWLSHTSWADPD